MWLFTKYGYFSVVRTSPNEYHVRARVKKDLENLCDAINLVKKISASKDADYRYCIVVGGEVYRTITQLLTQSVDYDNCKAKIAMTEDQREKLKAYHQIWETMRDLQDRKTEEE